MSSSYPRSACADCALTGRPAPYSSTPAPSRNILESLLSNTTSSEKFMGSKYLVWSGFLGCLVLAASARKGIKLLTLRFNNDPRLSAGGTGTHKVSRSGDENARNVMQLV